MMYKLRNNNISGNLLYFSINKSTLSQKCARLSKFCKIHKGLEIDFIYKF